MKSWWLIIVYLLLTPITPVTMGMVVTLTAVGNVAINRWAPLAVVVGILTDVSGVTLVGVSGLLFLAVGAVTGILRMRFEAYGLLINVVVAMLSQGLWLYGSHQPLKWWVIVMAGVLVWLLSQIVHRGGRSDVVYLRQ